MQITRLRPEAYKTKENLNSKLTKAWSGTLLVPQVLGRLGITQNLVEINKILTIDSQFKESCLTPDLGSKIEKRLSVIEFD